jgi:hypothetical protein
MLRVRVIMLVFAVMCAVSAVAAVSASAVEPDGIYQDPNTTKAAIGARVTTKNIGVVKLEVAGQESIECTGSSGTATVKSTNKIEGTGAFTGCSTALGECKSSSAAGGEIKQPELSFTVGLQYNSSNGTWEPAALVGPLQANTFTCAGGFETITATGSIVVALPSAVWLGEGNNGLLFHLKFSGTSGVPSGSQIFRESPTSATVKDFLTVKGSGLKAFNAQGAESGEFSFGFSEKVTILS